MPSSLIFLPGALLYMMFPRPFMCSDCYSRIPLQYLLEEGVTFYTVQPLCDICSSSSLGDIVVIVPIWLSNYILKASDHDVYVHHHATILSSLRGCAALVLGGIVGHLAREHLAIDSTCLGPSSYVTVHHVGFNIVDGDGRRYWNDELTNDEIDVICRLHHCYTGI